MECPSPVSLCLGSISQILVTCALLPTAQAGPQLLAQRIQAIVLDSILSHHRNSLSDSNHDICFQP